MSKDPEKDGEKLHTPEYILLEAEETQQKRSEEEKGDVFKTMREIGAKHFPFRVRLVILLAFFPLLLAAIATMLYLTVTFALAVVTVFQSAALNSHLDVAWGTFKTVFVLILGFLIAFFSPAFGFSVIMLYFVLHSKEKRGAHVRRFFQSRFQRF